MLLSGFDHDHFGVMPTLHMLGLGDSLRGYCLRMMQNLVRDFVFIQTIDQLLWYFHNRLRGKSITFPCDLYSLKTSEHRRKAGEARKNCVWLHAKFVRMNMTRRSK